MIGGNLNGELQIKTTSKNEIGESVPTWRTTNVIRGFLDLSSGDSNYSNYNAKIQESTHVFICDYVELDKEVNSENSRMIIDGYIYDVMLIDNPMNMNKHFEIYLKYAGGQNVK